MSNIQFTELKCRRCGGKLIANGGIYTCESCGKTYEKQIENDFATQLNSALDGQKQEQIANIRQLLWKETHEEYISNKEVERLCKEILKYLPEDFYANFYLATCSKSKSALGVFLSGVDIEKNYSDIPDILDYILKALKPEWAMTTGNFIERAYKGSDLKLYHKYRTWFDDENAKNDECVYQTDFPRDIFVAYSSKDMPMVEELVSVLEDSELTCFVAARNLRHGSGAVENYEKAIHDAIDHCAVLVFVSSDNSRSIYCDAYKELNYIEGNRKNMSRVEYLIKDYGKKPSERFYNKFFDGLEYCVSAQDVADRVCNIVMGGEKKKPVKSVKPAKEEKSVKPAKKEEAPAAPEETKKQLAAEKSADPLSIGDYKEIGNGYITFGTYPQSKKSRFVKIGEVYDSVRGYFWGSDKNLYCGWNGGYYKVEPIKWKILQRGSELFVVSDIILDAHFFDNSSNDYNNSEIRKWLNGEFFNTAFGDSQKVKILNTNIGNIFLLSEEEVDLYECKYKRKVSGYTLARGLQEREWWLRSKIKTTYGEDRQQYVNRRLNIGSYSYENSNIRIGVVPALKIKL